MTQDGAQRGAAVLRRHPLPLQLRTEREITNAHHAACTCGGAGPGAGCPACEMWHRLFPSDPACNHEWVRSLLVFGKCELWEYQCARCGSRRADESDAGGTDPAG